LSRSALRSEAEHVGGALGCRVSPMSDKARLCRHPERRTLRFGRTKSQLPITKQRGGHVQPVVFESQMVANQTRTCALSVQNSRVRTMQISSQLGATVSCSSSSLG